MIANLTEKFKKVFKNNVTYEGFWWIRFLGILFHVMLTIGFILGIRDWMHGTDSPLGQLMSVRYMGLPYHQVLINCLFAGYTLIYILFFVEKIKGLAIFLLIMNLSTFGMYVLGLSDYGTVTALEISLKMMNVNFIAGGAMSVLYLFRNS